MRYQSTFAALALAVSSVMGSYSSAAYYANSSIAVTSSTTSIAPTTSLPSSTESVAVTSAAPTFKTVKPIYANSSSPAVGQSTTTLTSTIHKTLTLTLTGTITATSGEVASTASGEIASTNTVPITRTVTVYPGTGMSGASTVIAPTSIPATAGGGHSPIFTTKYVTMTKTRGAKGPELTVTGVPGGASPINTTKQGTKMPEAFSTASTCPPPTTIYVTKPAETVTVTATVTATPSSKAKGSAPYPTGGTSTFHGSSGFLTSSSFRSPIAKPSPSAASTLKQKKKNKHVTTLTSTVDKTSVISVATAAASSFKV